MPERPSATGQRFSNLTRCAECGMHTSSAREFHPWLFCLLYKNGVSNPAAHLASLGYVRPGVSA